MQINNVEALKAWLTGRLEKICDADPAALAKYVVALVKKDKLADELKKVCIDQLEVFLSNETTAFVNTLFEVLQNGAYLPSSVGSPVSVGSTHVPLAPQVPATVSTPLVPSSSDSVSVSPAVPNQEKPRKASGSEDAVAVRHEASVIDDDERDFRRTRRPVEEEIHHDASSPVVSSTAERKRKRHTEEETNRRSKSSRDDHDRIRKLESNRHSDEDHDRRKEDDDRRRRVESRNDRRRDDRHNPHIVSTNSQENDRIERLSPTRDRQRGRPGIRGWRMDNDRGRIMGNRGAGGYPGKRMRCRDYDEKGFCMRGEFCQFDHGNDPVVVDDLLPNMLNIQSQQRLPMPYIPDGPPPSLPPFPHPNIPPNMMPGIPLNIPPNNLIVSTSQNQPPPPGTNDPSAGNRAPPAGQEQPKPSPESTEEASHVRPVTTAPPVSSQSAHPEIRSVLPGQRLPVRHPGMQGPRQPGMHPGMQRQRLPGAHPGMHALRPSGMHDLRQPAPHGLRPPGLHMGMQGQRPLLITSSGEPFSGSGSDTYNPEQPSFDRPTNPLPMWARLGGAQMPPPPVQVAMMQNMRTRELVELTSQSKIPPPQITLDPVVSDVQRTVLAPPPSDNKIQAVNPLNTQQYTSSASSTEPVINPATEQKPRPFKTTLELRKVPREYNNIAKLNEYFSKFGNIVNIQVSPKNISDAAIIQFASQDEARKAYSCPDAVLGNRFIKQFWHNPENNGNSTNKNVQSASKPGDPASVTPAPPKPKLKPTMFQSGKTTFVKSAPVAATLPAPVVPKPPQTKAQKVVKTKEMMKKKLDIQKQKQELLEKQISQQKLLISKLEKAKNMNPEDRAMLMKSLKALTDSIDTLKKETTVSAVIVKSKENPVKARQAAQKEILDRELDIITHQHHGEDTTELRHQVEELKHEAQSLGLLVDSPTRGRGRGTGRGAGRGTQRGRGRGRGVAIGRLSNTVLDNRPKQLIIRGFLAEEKDQVVEHFQSFGEVDRVEPDKTGANIVLTYKTRKQAEIASCKGVIFGKKMLNISWYKAPPVPSSTSEVSAGTKPLDGVASRRISSSDILLEELSKDELLEEKTEEELTAVDEELLLGDYDEDEDEEERSWRR